MKLLGTPEAVFMGLLCNSTDSSDVKCLCSCALDARGVGGGHCLFEGRYPKQNYRPPVLCHHSPLSLPLLVYSPLCWAIKGQPIVITVVTAVYFQQA